MPILAPPERGTSEALSRQPPAPNVLSRAPRALTSRNLCGSSTSCAASGFFVRDTKEMSPGLRVLALIIAAVAVVPMVMPYTVERSEGDKVCVALRDTWHRDRPRPSESDLREVEGALTAPLPTPEQMRDPQTRAAYLTAERRRQSTPGYKRAATYIEWRSGPGACVPGAHRRALLSAVLASVAVAIGFALRIGHRRSSAGVRT